MSIIRLDNGRWYTKAELARRLDVSKRTITNYVHKGKVQKRETTTGVVFRVVTEETETFPPEGNGKESISTSNHAGAEANGKGEAETETSGNFRPPESLPTNYLDRLEAAHQRIAELERTAGRADVLAEVVEHQSEQLEQAWADVDKWRTRAEERGHDAVKWRARYHVARGRAEMEDE